ncbi:MAG: hypothetical protein ACREOS_04385 [Candidatus Dormibacteraceae bacterium]
MDGKRVGSLHLNDTIQTPIEPGRHTLQVHNGRTSSGARSGLPLEQVSAVGTVSYYHHGSAITRPRRLRSPLESPYGTTSAGYPAP